MFGILCHLMSSYPGVDARGVNSAHVLDHLLTTAHCDDGNGRGLPLGALKAMLALQGLGAGPSHLGFGYL